MKGCITTFFSFKGGVGRTMALANVAVLLARTGRRVLCVDADLEAPGLSRYFSPWKPGPDGPGFIELVQSHDRGERPSWQDYIQDIPIPGLRGTLSFMPAGAEDPSYNQRVQSVDWFQLHRSKGLGSFLADLREDWRETYDFVLLDSRTGITDTGGTCTSHLPDQLVVLYTLNWQGLQNLPEVAQSAKATHGRLWPGRAKLRVLPIATRVERTEVQQMTVWLARAAQVFAPLCRDWLSPQVVYEDFQRITAIPHTPRWSYGEGLPVQEEKGERTPGDIGFALENLAALLAHKLEGAEMLLSQRDEYVKSASRFQSSAPNGKRRSMKRGHPLPELHLVVIAAPADRRLSGQMIPHLSVLPNISVWTDSNACAGQNVIDEAAAHLEQADVIVFLISPDLLSSNLGFASRLKRASQLQHEGRAVIVPILLRPMALDCLPFDRASLLPSSLRAVKQFKNKDEAWRDIVHRLQVLTQDIRSRLMVGRTVCTPAGRPSVVAGTAFSYVPHYSRL